MRRPRRKDSKQTTHLSILSPSYAKFQLNNLLELLNKGTSKIPNPDADSDSIWKVVDKSDVQRRLKSLVSQWMECDQNLSKLFRRSPTLAHNCANGKTFLIPNRDGIPQLAWSPVLSDGITIPVERTALTHFVQLIVNPLAPTLGGPCARCGNFYAKKTKRQNTYCSKNCGSASTALLATRKRRDEAKVEKIQWAQKEIWNWDEARPPQPWKKWVSARTRGEITVKWLTRAAGEGLIARPWGEI